MIKCSKSVGLMLATETSMNDCSSVIGSMYNKKFFLNVDWH